MWSIDYTIFHSAPVTFTLSLQTPLQSTGLKSHIAHTERVKMGVWDFIGSAAEAVNQNAPDATPVKNACKTSYNFSAAAFNKIDAAVAAPVKNACRSSYTYGSAAVGKVNQAISINDLYRIGQWMRPDDETKSQIGLYAANFAKNAGGYAIQEGYKLIPGGVAFSKIVSKTLNDVKYENLKSEKLKLSEEQAVAPQKIIGRAEMNGQMGVKAVSSNAVSAADKSPEDVIRVFMMKEFCGTHFFDDSMVHQLARKKGKKPE